MEWKERTEMRANHIAVFGALVASAGALAVKGADLPSVPPPPSSALEDRVGHELRMLPYYSVFDDLSYRVDGSTVTLTGQVTQPVIKIDAESAVKHIAGVTNVNSQIEVLPLSDFDRRIRMKAYFAIYGYGPLQRYGLGTRPPIHILVKDGHITLKGVVDSDMDRNMVYIRANQVPGAFSVTNELVVQKQS
jgi:hyperosmotically inducible protein